MDFSNPFISDVLSETMHYCFYSLGMKETSYMLAQTNSTPDEHICSLVAYMHVQMHAYDPVLAHP